MASAVSPSFASHLTQWGPKSDTSASLAEANRYCRRLSTSHYENFPVLSYALPKRLRQPMSAIYAFCRWADDLGDEVADPRQSLELLSWWRGETVRCFDDGEASHPVFVSLRDAIAIHDLRRQPFLDLIDAFEQDQRVVSYETFEQLLDYCSRSANPVGRIVLRLQNVDTDERVALSDRVCTGLQLINFWQDVARDADIGRTYLPKEDRVRFGYTDAMLASRNANAQFRELLMYEVDRARSFLSDGDVLARSLRGRFRVAVDLFARGGLAICDAVERVDYDVWSIRPTVSKRQGLRLFLSSIASCVRRKR